MIKQKVFYTIQVFVKGPCLYAFKGLSGRFAPIGVHVAMILIMAGGTLTASGSFKGSVDVPQGLNFVMGDVLGPTGFLSSPNDALNTEVHVNRFYMDYFPTGEVGNRFMFYTKIASIGLRNKRFLGNQAKKHGSNLVQERVRKKKINNLTRDLFLCTLFITSVHIR